MFLYRYLFLFILFPALTISLQSQVTVKCICNVMGANEPSVAINPANPANIVAGANLSEFRISLDSGNSWTGYQMASHLGEVWGDPCLVFDSKGNLYYGHLMNTKLGFLSELSVQKSTDGGVTFPGEASIGQNKPKQQDKEWIVADMSDSKFRNNLYISWTQFDDYGNLIKGYNSNICFSRSTDEGLTWSKSMIISDESGNCLDGDSTVEGAVPAVGPDGEIYTAWSGPKGIMFDRSFDGGLTFGKDIFISDQPGGWAYNIPGLVRCDGLPVTVCDLSHTKYRGNIYVLWSDQRNGVKDTDVFLSRSTDRGETWSAPKRVNNDTTKTHQFMTWLAVDPVTGVLWSVFYDRRAGIENQADIYIAKSSDGGETFENIHAAKTTIDESQWYFYGDYTNIAAYNGRVYFVWTQNEGIYLGIYHDTTRVTAVRSEANSPELSLLQNYPNPFDDFTVIKYVIPEPAFVKIEICSSNGTVVDILDQGYKQAGAYSTIWKAGNCPSGIYFYRLSMGDKTIVKECVLLK